MMVSIRKRAKPVKTSKKIGIYTHSNVKIAIGILIIAILVVSGIYVLTTPKESHQNIPEGKAAGEDFIFTSLDGNEVHLSSYRGTIVILDMWATWCNPCQFQMTELKKIYDHYTRDELEIFSVDIGDSETSQQIQSFRDEFENQLDIELNWIFGKDDGSIWQKYMINGGIPTLCIFDQEGSLSFQHEGAAVFSEIPSGWPEDTLTLAQKIDDLLQ